VDSDNDGFFHGKEIQDSRFWAVSRGPDRFFELTRITNEYSVPEVPDGWATILVEFALGGDGIYDPTNGTLSKGDIDRSIKGLNNGK
jgi:hypothetical protein